MASGHSNNISNNQTKGEIMGNYGAFLRDVGSAIGTGLQAAAGTSARAAAQANAVSRQAQAAQGAFNQASANTANSIGDNRLTSQYSFNSGAAQAANDFTSNMWNQTAAWNEEMWERQAEFNAREAQKQRDWAERMDNTRYQRAITDMQTAGLNPILAVTGGGIDTGGVSGATASVGGAQMSSAQGQMASGGLLNGISASEGNYTGQMEYMGGILGLLAATMNGISSAMQNMGNMGSFGEELGEALSHLLNPYEWANAKESSLAYQIAHFKPSNPYKTMTDKPDFKGTNNKWVYDWNKNKDLQPRDRFRAHK